MGVDLMAGVVYPGRVPARDGFPTILVFDSGVGGLTVHAEIVRALPGADIVYAADDAGFPYGAWPEDALVARVEAAIEALAASCEPDIAVIACNTASTLVLPSLRRRFPFPFVGTVPAVKPAAERSRSRVIAVLATPGTVKRDYTKDLVRTYAGDCRVDLVGSTRLAGLAEQALRGETVGDDAIAAEIAPCFVTEPDGRRTDSVVLACTHYPLLADRFTRLAPWPVDWIDPAPAIARRVVDLLGGWGGEARKDADARAVFTGPAARHTAMAAMLAGRGIGRVERMLEPARS